MAYNFVRASNQSVSSSGPAISFYPVTFSAWAFGTNNTVAMTVMSWIKPASSLGFRIIFAGQAAGDPVRGNLFETTNLLSSGPGFQINTWHHVCFVCASSTSRIMYLDGTAGATNTVDSTPTDLTRIVIGSNLNEAFDGNVSDVAVWSASLSNSEINSLAKGFSAKKIRPQSLEYYVPLVRNIYEYKNKPTLTNNNSATVANHNRIYS